MKRLNRSPYLHPHWLGLDRDEREDLAARLGTSYGYLELLAGGFKLPSLEFACKLVQEMPWLTHQGFVDAYRARYPKSAK